MQTILLQDNPALFRGLEHSLLCREEIRLVTAAGEIDLLDRCRSSEAQVVLAAADTLSDAALRRLEALPHAPLCLRVHDGGEARRLLPRVVERLGTNGRRHARHPVRLRVKVVGERGACRGWTRDLSQGGVFVGTPLAGEMAGMLDIIFQGHPRAADLVCRGEIARRVPPDAAGGRLPGLAVRFASGSRLGAGQLAALLSAAPV